MEMNKKPRIGILAPMGNWDAAYSHCSVVADQFYMLKKYGYDPIFITLQRFKGKEELEAQGIEVRDVLPVFKFYDYHLGVPIEKDFEKNVEDSRTAIESALQDITHVITHDVIFQGWFLPYNVGMRKDNVNVKW